MMRDDCTSANDLDNTGGIVKDWTIFKLLKPAF